MVVLMQNQRRLFFLVVLFLLYIPATLLAERRALAKSNGVTVNVRTVRATNIRPHGAKEKLEVDKRLADLTPKLRKFQYQDYSLIASKQEFIGLTSRKEIALNEGYSLAMRPLYIDGKRVGMWLRWQDAHGMKLLDTRMHFNCGVPVLTGTESSPDSGVILAISVAPSPGE